MSMSYSDTSTSQGGREYKNLRQTTRDRLLYEMLRSAKRPDSKSNKKVLILDKLTVKIMSCSCKMPDLTEEGVSLVEDINKIRKPWVNWDAVYYIQPTKENVLMFMSDMAGSAPLYRDAYVYFSSSAPKKLIDCINKEQSVKSRLRAMKEMNLEYSAIDSQCFITDNTMVLEELYRNEEMTPKGHECLNMMANRIATVFASLLEFPYIRYRAAKSIDTSTMTTIRDIIPTKLAAAVWNCLMNYKSIEGFNFPERETCELLILDRSVDQIAPVIHEWTYDAMCHDLLNMDGNIYVHEVASETGGPEEKEVLLEDHDPVWLELRHSHIADASERLHKMSSSVSKNKAAQMHGSRVGSELSTRDLQKMVQALPQYLEQKDKLSLHVDIAKKIDNIIRESGLKEVGKLEQDLVFGDAGTKELLNFLKAKRDDLSESKLRLLMIYAATHPDKYDSDEFAKLIEEARLPRDDITAVYNMRFLEGSSDSDKSAMSAFTFKLDVHKKKKWFRKDRTGEEQTWQLSRFYPVIEELIEKLSKNELSKNDYPYLNEPSPSFHGLESAKMVDASPAHSMRSRRTAMWARPRDGFSSDSILRHASSDSKKMGRRLFVFIVGGATRSELRVCHKLTNKLKREVVLGSSSLDDPLQFITKLKLLTANEHSLDDLEI